jgi:hypothetical protein
MDLLVQERSDIPSSELRVVGRAWALLEARSSLCEAVPSLGLPRLDTRSVSAGLSRRWYSDFALATNIVSEATFDGQECSGLG